jgi:hypothetical protein
MTIAIGGCHSGGNLVVPKRAIPGVEGTRIGILGNDLKAK